jgi:hypothetical protein
VFVQSSETLGGSFDVLGGEVSNTSIFDHSNKPPITVAIVQKHHGISLGGVCLPIDGRDEIVKRIDEFEIDILCALLVLV